MNLVGYDAMAIGNHEFDFGKARLERSRKEARFAWLSANTLAPSGDPAFPPMSCGKSPACGSASWVSSRTRSETGSARLCSRRCASPSPSRSRRRWVPVLRGEERCDLVVVVTHQGFERDPATGKDSARRRREPRAMRWRPRFRGSTCC